MTLTSTIEEMTDDKVVEQVRDDIHHHTNNSSPHGFADQASTWLGKVNRWGAQRLGRHNLAKLANQDNALRSSLEALPERLEKASAQAQLIKEMLDDYRSGAYDNLSWKSVGLATSALLYVVNPLDVVPDVLAGLGQVDDLVVLTVTTRLLRAELEAYCLFKGYDQHAYFVSQEPTTAQA